MLAFAPDHSQGVTQIVTETGEAIGHHDEGGWRWGRFRAHDFV